MGKEGGRRRDKVWEHFTRWEGGKVKCKHCGDDFAATTSATRLKHHIHKIKGHGISVCTGFPQSNSVGSHKPNSSNDLEHNLLHSQDHSMTKNEAGQIQADDAEDQEGIQVGSRFVSNGENEDLQMMKRYVFECLRPEDKVFVSPLSYLTQEEFITLKPKAHLDSLVIDIFVEILTNIERKKKTMPSNWYLPVTFSNAALKGKVGHFLNFVHGQKIKENYMSDPEFCEKIFIPVHVGTRQDGGHFYLYIFHLKNKEIEIWDSLSNTFVAEKERDETTKKLLLVMEKLFEEVTFTKFHWKMADDIHLQSNGFDCGIFVINFMEQSKNYVKRNPLFQFDSDKERGDLALKLLNSDLNQEKQNLYDTARRHYAQVEKQDGFKRLRVDASETCIEDAGREKKAEYDDRVNGHDGLQKGSSKGYILPTRDLIGKQFQRYTEQIWEWIMDDKVSAIGVCGIGGSGKTALAIHIHNKLILEEGGSDIKVIWVTVSQKYSISQLQRVIARSIELDISDEIEVKRIAGKLLQAFKEMKKCVVILDDVWDHLFLNEVGFPMADNRIKLILTTRIRDVCQGMNCEKNTIEVGTLNGYDSWALFQKIAKCPEELSFKVDDIVQNMVNECNGLALAIVRMATGMKGKKWSQVLECLENLGDGQYEIEKWVLPVLRSSYDFLTNKLQRFFLYCALGTDGSFDADPLMRRFVIENIDEKKMLRVQFNEGYNMLDKLNNHGMLEQCHDGWRMNRFLRVLAIGIAEDTGQIMANAYKDLEEIPSDDQWKDDLQKVFLTGNNIQTIPNSISPRCSQLSTLLLDDNANLNSIAEEFFNNMLALKTLNLCHTGIERLPESVSDLKCLVALLLSSCYNLSYIPSLEKLKQLRSLDLSHTAITEAPKGLKSLVNLRCLNLLGTGLVMSASLISKLINLEWLELEEMTAAAIQGLKKLEVIVAVFNDISAFNTFVNFLDNHWALSSLNITLQGEIDDIWDDEETSRECSGKRITFKGVDLGNGKAELPRDMKELFIKNCQLGTGVGYLCSAFSSSYDLQIERLVIRDCEEVEYLCCLSRGWAFCISSENVGSSPFCHIRDLSIRGCDSMEFLMTPKLLATLHNLRSIEVRNCWMMKEIVGEEHYSEMQLSHPTITLPKWTSLKLEDMTQLNYVYRGLMLCPSLQTFSAECCDELNAPHIKISSSDGLVLLMQKTHSGYRWPNKSD